ncbi:hypothetical protein IT157_09425 [bacterium]|nr:hypothetical protein [bacterium]
MKLPTTLILSSLALALLVLFVASCDERNEADLAPEIYKLIATIDPEGDALHADAAGNYLAVAGASSGVKVYNAADPRNLEELFSYVPPLPYYTVSCILDPINHLVALAQNPSGPNLHKIFNFENGAALGVMRFTGIPIKLQMRSRADSIVIWGTDPTDGFIADLWCKASETEWTPGCPSVWFWFGGVGQRGFDVNENHAAIATNQYRVKIHDVANNLEVSATGTPGDPQDCAWFGNYIVVADNFYLTILDATTAASPTAVSSIIIPGADRLNRVLMDGNHAVLLDDSDGIYVVSLSDTQHPVLQQTISLPEPASISISNGNLFVADQQLGVLVYKR